MTKEVPHAFWSRVVTTELILFLGLWLIYGLVINSKNIEDFGASTIEAIAVEHRFTVDNLKSWPKTEDFGYLGHAYSNKQPGQAMAGAVAYWMLSPFGVSYDSDRIFAQALVIFLTASFLTALTGVAVFRLARGLDDGESRFWPVVTALAFGLGTTAFAYSGIAHHDVIATAYLVIAFCLIFSLRHSGIGTSTRATKVKAAVAGLLLGLTLTTSMLLFFMVLVVGIYFLTTRKWKLLSYFIAGGFLGLVPLFVYDWVCFGNPFLMAAVANYKFTGYDPEVFFYLNLTNFLEKVHVYEILTVLYDPVLVFGLIGLFFIQKKYRVEKFVIAAAIFVLLFYITNVEGLGTCAYGPRYMLPVMPFAALGVIGLRRVPLKPLAYLTQGAMLLIGARSAFINFVGAVEGAMYCNMAGYAYPGYLDMLMKGQTPSFPLYPYLLPVAEIFCVIVVLLFVKQFVDRPAPV